MVFVFLPLSRYSELLVESRKCFYARTPVATAEVTPLQCDVTKVFRVRNLESVDYDLVIQIVQPFWKKTGLWKTGGQANVQINIGP